MNTPRGVDRMSHSPFPRGATAREIQAVEHLHQVADRHKEPEVRRALSGAVELIVELIEDRFSRRGLDDQWDCPHDEG
jgi:hypothetical protein